MISISNERGLLQRISIGPHTLHSDVPVELGGTDAAPEPHDLFDAALGACKALTVAPSSTGTSLCRVCGPMLMR